MANTGISYEVEVKFIDKGFSQLEKKLQNLSVKFPHLVDIMKRIDIPDTMMSKLVTTEKNVLRFYSKIKSVAEELDDIYNGATGMSQGEAEAYFVSQAHRIDTLRAKLAQYATQVGRLESAYQSFSTVARNSGVGLEKFAQHNIKALKELGVSQKAIKQLTGEFEHLKKVADQTNDIRVLYKFESQLEKKVALVRQFDQELKKLNNIQTPLNTKKIVADINQAKSQITTANASLEKFKNKLVNIKDTTKELLAEDKVRVSTLQKLTALEKELSTVKNASVREYLTKQTEAAKQQTFNPKAHREELKATYSILREEIKKAKVEQQDINKAVKTTEKELDKLIGSLSKQLNKATELKKEYRDIADKESLRNLDAYISKIEGSINQIIKLKSVAKNATNVGDLLPVKSAAVAGQVGLTGMRQQYKEIELDVKLRPKKEDLEKVIQDLKVKLGSLNLPQDKITQVTSKLVEADVLLQKGGKANLQTAKQITKEIATRIDNYRKLEEQADKLVKQEILYQQGMEKAQLDAQKLAQRIKDTAKAQLNFSQSVAVLNKDMRMAIKNAKDFSVSLKPTKDLIREYDKVVKQIEGKILALETKIKARSRFANPKDLEQAEVLLTKYKKALEAVEKKRDEILNRKVGILDFDKEIKSYSAFINAIKSGDISSLQGNLSKVKKELEALGVVTNKETIALEKLNHQYARTNAALSESSIFKLVKVMAFRAVTYASLYVSLYQVFALIRKGVEYVIELDNNIKTMSAVFGVSAKTAQSLQQSLIALGKTYGGSIKSINEAAMALGRAGISAEKVAAATEIVIKMAKLTGDSINVSADAVITFSQVFEDATHPIEKLGDELAYVANQSRLSTQDIGTFSNYALAAAKSANLTVEAINAMAISFSNAGVNASTIGTQIRRFSSLMRDNSTAVKNFFLSIGTSQEYFRARLMSSAEDSNKAMLDLVTRLKEMSQAEFQKAVAGMDILAAQSVTLLRNNADAFIYHFKALINGVDGELNKANLVSESYISNWERLSVTIGEAFTKLSAKVFPIINSLVKKTANVINIIADNWEQFTKSISIGLAVAFSPMAISMIIAAANAMKVFAAALLIAETRAIALEKAIALLKAAIIALSKNPIVALIVGIGTALTATAISFRDNTTEAYKFAEGLVRVASVANYAAQNLDKLGSELDKNMQAVRKELEEAAKDYRDSLAKAQDEMSKSGHVTENTKMQLKYWGESVVKLQELLTLMKKQKELQAIQEQINTKKILMLSAITNIEKEAIQRQLKTLEFKKQQLILERQIKQEQLKLLELRLRADKGAPLLKDKDKEKYLSKLQEQIQKTKDTIVSLQQKLVELKTGTKGFGNRKVPILVDKTQLKNLDDFINAMKKLEKANIDISGLKQKFVSHWTGVLKEFQNSYSKIAIEQMQELFANEKGIKEKYKDLFDEKIVWVLDAKEPEEQMKRLLQLQLEFKDKTSDLFKIKDNQRVVAITQTLEQAIKNAVELKSKVADIENTKAPKQKFIDLVIRFKTDDTKIEELKKRFEESLKLHPPEFQFDTSKFTPVIEQYQELFKKMPSGFDKLALDWEAQSWALLKNIFVLKEKIVDVSAVAESGSKVWAEYFKSANEYFKKYNKIATIEEMMSTKNRKLSKLDQRRIIILQQIELLEKKIAEYNARKVKDTKQETELKREAQQLQGELKQIDQKRYTLTQAVLNLEKQKTSELQKQIALQAKVKDKTASLKGNFTYMMTTRDIQGTLADIKRAYQQNPAEGEKAQTQFLEAYKEKYAGQAGLSSLKYGENTGQIKENLQRVLAVYDAYYAQKEAMAKSDAQKEQIRKEKDLAVEKAVAMAKQGIWRVQQQHLVEGWANAAGQLSQTIDTLYKAGIIKGKAWLKAMKSLQVVSTTLTTISAAWDAYAGWMRMFKATGNPAFQVLADVSMGTTMALGMAKVAAIVAQKYHTGGYVGTTNGTPVGGLKDKEITAVLEKGEYVLTAKETQALSALGGALQNNQQSSVQKHETVIINTMDKSVMQEWATSREGREIIKNIVRA